MSLFFCVFQCDGHTALKVTSGFGMLAAGYGAKFDVTLYVLIRRIIKSGFRISDQ
jgi:hypothetical protein